MRINFEWSKREIQIPTPHDGDCYFFVAIFARSFCFPRHFDEMQSSRVTHEISLSNVGPIKETNHMKDHMTQFFTFGFN